MPARNFPELGGRTIGRRVNPTIIINENAGLLDIDPAAFQKSNLVAGQPSGNTINETLTSPLQGNQVMPIQSGVLGGSVYVLKSAGVAGAPFVVGRYSDPAGAGGSTDPEHATYTNLVYVRNTERPLGIVMHDLAGNRFDSVGGEETELSANYYDGAGTHLDVFVYETHERQEYANGDLRTQTGVHNHVNVPLTYSGGDFLFIDVISGLLTNRRPRSTVAALADISAYNQGNHSALWGEAGFDPSRVINGVHPDPVAILLNVPTSEYRALRLKTLV